MIDCILLLVFCFLVNDMLIFIFLAYTFCFCLGCFSSCRFLSLDIIILRTEVISTASEVVQLFCPPIVGLSVWNFYACRRSFIAYQKSNETYQWCKLLILACCFTALQSNRVAQQYQLLQILSTLRELLSQNHWNLQFPTLHEYLWLWIGPAYNRSTSLLPNCEYCF